jgi:hypothetical protein
MPMAAYQMQVGLGEIDASLRESYFRTRDIRPKFTATERVDSAA